MPRSVNKAILVGNVGADPEIRTIGSGAKVANVSLATGRQWTDKSGEKKGKTEWHRLVIWEKLADVVERYVTKGDSLYIEGEIEYRQYEDKDGVTKYMAEIRVRELVMLGGKEAPQRQPTAATAKKEESYEDFSGGGFPNPEDDDLPFAPCR